MPYPMNTEIARDVLNKSKCLDILAKHFKIDRSRDLLAVEIQFYQMDLRGIVEEAKKYSQEMDPDFLPSWAKFCEAPMKAKGFWTYMIEALFLHKHNSPELYTGQHFEDFAEGPRVAMMFLGKIRNKHLELAAAYAQEVLPGWIVQYINGNVTNGHKAEKFANNVIKEARDKGKNVLFIAANMAQRSFSVSEITELYLAFDGGEAGATIQKMSRALTPWKKGKISKIVSLSFDPNRDDTFDLIIITTARNYKKKHNEKSLREALRKVLRTIDVFQCTSNNTIKINDDLYLETLIQSNRFGRAVGRMIELDGFTLDQLWAISEGNTNYFNRDREETADKGKTREPEEKKKDRKERDEEQKMKDKARRVIVTFCEYVDIVILGTERDTVHDALVLLDTDKELQANIYKLFELDYEIARVILHRINQDFLQLLLDK